LRSTLLPGWGQLAADRPILGRILVFVTGLLLILALTVFLFVEPIEVYAWLANPDVLLAVVLGNIALAAMRLFATGHAWVVTGGRRWFAGVLLAVFVGIPHVAVAWVGLETRDSLMKLFPESTPAIAAPDTTVPAQSTTTTVPPTTTTTAFEPITVAPAAPGEYGDDQLDLTEVPLWRPFGEDRLNILLLGGDAGPRRSGLRTDTMIVASIDPVTGDTALIGVPRNFGGVTFKDGTRVPVRILNAVYGWGRANPDGFNGPDPGADATREVIENITGLEIDYFMLADLTGFADLVDAFGGVRINVPRAVDGPLYDTVGGGYEMVRIPAGDQTLDGSHALAYARARYGSSDYSRMGRQRCLLAAMARDADPLGLVARLSSLLEVVETHMTTDFPIEQVSDLIRIAPRIDSRQIRVIGFDSTWTSGWTADGYRIPDIVRIRDTVREAIEDPAGAAELGVDTVESACT
jgi:polyisoprenyl-teichoic acid--peptidoglycan teichoic acid transferase